MEKGAIISECGKYRYQLWRIWDNTKSLCMWVMHNPSTADANEDDPTIRRCIGFAKSWGYGGIYVGNIFAYRATNPKDMKGKSYNELVGENRQHIKDMESKCDLIIEAMGNPVISSVMPFTYEKEPHYLKLTKAGNPCHPLYLKSDLTPIKY